MFTYVYHSLLMPFYLFLSLFNRVYLGSLVYIYVDHSLLDQVYLFSHVYSCLPVLTLVYLCLRLFSCV